MEKNVNDQQDLLANSTERGILDSYFSIRVAAYDGDLYPVRERKTTADIAEDLHKMLEIEDKVIADYMLSSGFQPVIGEDGTPIWEFYRMR